MPLLSLLRRTSDYIGSHATERRAPSGTECCTCEASEPGTSEAPVTLAKCSICEEWLCTGCYTMHSAPAGWDDSKPSLWKRLLKVVRRG